MLAFCGTGPASAQFDPLRKPAGPAKVAAAAPASAPMAAPARQAVAAAGAVAAVLFGRSGHATLSAAALPPVDGEKRAAIAAIAFKPGQRYEDLAPGDDGVPQGGIASLTAPGAAGPSAALLAGLPAASSPHDGWAAMIPGLFAMKSVKLAIFAVLALAAGAKKIKDALTGGRGAGTGGRAGLARFDQLAKGKSA